MNFSEEWRNSPVYRIWPLMIVATGLFACAPAAERAPTDGWPEARPVGASILPKIPPEPPAFGPSGEIVPDEPSDELSLRDALALALLKSPELAVFSWEVRAANARILQASLIPNPELGVEVENFGGSGTQKSFEGAESTIALSQLIELGGKRDKRTRVATLERDLAGWDYEAKRLDVYIATAKTFMKTLAAQRLAELRQEQLTLANRVLISVSERVQAGRASPLEEARASVAMESSRVSAQRATRGLQAARDQLVAMWGSTNARFTRATGELDKISVLPPVTDLLVRLSENPDLARMENEFELRRSNLALAKANDMPDITFSAGVRRFEETGDNAFIAGFSIPIPVFGVNPGGILEAERRLSQQKSRQQATAAGITSTLKEAYSEAAALYSEILALRSTILPGAQKAFEAAQQGYAQGKFDFLEVLDAQRTFFEVRERYLLTAVAYHEVTLDLERLTGKALIEPPGPAGDGNKK